MRKELHVAYYVIALRNLDEANDTYVSLSNLKLQKLLYYCNGAHIKWDNAPLFTGNLFEAWAYGPTIRNVYDVFNQFGQNDIHVNMPKIKLEPNEKETIEAVWSQLKHLSVFTLVDRTILETPWRNARERNSFVIYDKDIQDYFTKQEVLT